MQAFWNTMANVMMWVLVEYPIAKDDHIAADFGGALYMSGGTRSPRSLPSSAKRSIEYLPIFAMLVHADPSGNALPRMGVVCDAVQTIDSKMNLRFTQQSSVLNTVPIC